VDQWQAQQANIIEFIERHAPALNHRLKRAYAVSSSNSESESDEETVDDEYFAFLANSIHADGVSATSTSAKPKVKTEPMKPQISPLSHELHKR
jgi:hypothetical protein